MAEIRWIDRDKDGYICGTYARKQRENQEFLPEDSEEMLEFAEFLKNPEIRDTLEEFTKKQVQILDDRTKEYVYSKYPIHRQISLQKLQTDSRLAGLKEAADYTDLVWNWMQTVFIYYYTKEDEIVTIANDEKLSDDEKKKAILEVINNINLTVFDATDPKVTIRETMAKMQKTG